MNANHMTIGFIGLGLIGGSIAKTIRRIHPDSIIYGFDTDIDSLKMAKEDGTLTQYFETLDSTFSSCDIIFLCAPVSNNIEYLKELKGIISESCLLTDVGRTDSVCHQGTWHGVKLYRRSSDGWF